MADLQAKGAAPSSNSKAAIEKRVATLKSRLERIAFRAKRGDDAATTKVLAKEKEMREAELKYLDLKLSML